MFLRSHLKHESLEFTWKCSVALRVPGLIFSTFSLFISSFPWSLLLIYPGKELSGYRKYKAPRALKKSRCRGMNLAGVFATDKKKKCDAEEWLEEKSRQQAGRLETVTASNWSFMGTSVFAGVEGVGSTFSRSLPLLTCWLPSWW